MSPNPQDLRTHLEEGLCRGNQVTGSRVGPEPRGLCPCKKRSGHRHAQSDGHVRTREKTASTRQGENLRRTWPCPHLDPRSRAPGVRETRLCLTPRVCGRPSSLGKCGDTTLLSLRCSGSGPSRVPAGSGGRPACSLWDKPLPPSPVHVSCSLFSPGDGSVLQRPEGPARFLVVQK